MFDKIFIFLYKLIKYIFGGKYILNYNLMDLDLSNDFILYVRYDIWYIKYFL